MEKWRISILFIIVTSFGASAMIGCGREGALQNSAVNASRVAAQPKKTMRAFGSEQEMTAWFGQIAEEAKRKLERRRAAPSNAPAEADAPAAQAMDMGASTKSKDESVTNTQHAGVDEGGIVKLRGDHLVVLRRGRLFTIAVGDGALKPVSAVDAFGPDIDPRNTWYDEMLISGDRIVVIGYSYERGGTEIGLFDIDRAGNLEYRATYHLRSNDYYSSRNYSSRLIGDKLVFYTPHYLSPWSLQSEDLFKSFPSLRKWRKGAGENEFKRIISATNVYKAERNQSFNSMVALHTVTACDLARSDFACESTAVVGPLGRVFYVSPNSVYVWTTEWSFHETRSRPSSMLYRMPLDGSAPSALGVSGSPVDQFSFLESADNHINVLVRSAAAGDGMWAAEVADGDVALMRAPLANFSDGGDTAQASNYTRLPKPEGYTFQNRFVGDYLLYGSGVGWGWPEKAARPSLYVTRWAGGAPSELAMPHGVDRIETMGSGAVIVGADQNDLHFTSVRLGEQPALAGFYTRRNASQGELRSHGFFYKPEGPDSGLLGLPISGSGRPGYMHLFDGSASVLFLRNDTLRLKEIGELASRAKGSANDGCRASCVDWYGNARPLFLRGRIFALLGYEIVEGTLTGGNNKETRRVNFAPHRQQLSSR